MVNSHLQFDVYLYAFDRYMVSSHHIVFFHLVVSIIFSHADNLLSILYAHVTKRFWYLFGRGLPKIGIRRHIDQNRRYVSDHFDSVHFVHYHKIVVQFIWYSSSCVSGSRKQPSLFRNPLLFLDQNHSIVIFDCFQLPVVNWDQHMKHRAKSF